MTDELTRAIEAGARLITPVHRLVVTTGAGMSKESGIPTFRDAPSALWENYNPEELATPEGFRRDPPLVWRWYEARRQMIAAASPHAGHFALAELETLFDDYVLLTQNIDNLHRVAGSKELVEVHGNIFRFKCFDNEHPVASLPAGDDVPPRCHCGSMIRPDVVWFGEMPHDLDRAFEVLSMCGAVLVVGTSGLVHPAAGFAGVAKQAGAAVVEVNPERSMISSSADVFIETTAGEALPRLVDRVKAARRAE